MTPSFKSWLDGALKIALIILILAAASTVIRVGSRAERVLTVAEGTLQSVSDYSKFQVAMLQSPRSQKSIEASLEAAAAAKGTFLLINRIVVPRAVQVLDDLDAATKSLDQLIQNLDREANGRLLPEGTKLVITTRETVELTGSSVKALEHAITTAGEKAGRNLDDMHELLADESWARTLSNIESLTRHADGTASNIEAASRQLPSTAQSIEKIARTGSRYQKALLIGRLAGIAITAAAIVW